MITVHVCATCQHVSLDSSTSCSCGGITLTRTLEIPTHQNQVHDMMVALGIPLLNEDQPRLDNINFTLLYDLVAEEAKEFCDAMDVLAALKDEGLLEPPYRPMVLHWWAEVIDAICDIDVVIHNASNAMGIDIEPFFQEVHKTNMAKAGGPVRADGKRLKPEGWEPPRIREMLEELLNEKRTSNTPPLG